MTETTTTTGWHTHPQLAHVVVHQGDDCQIPVLGAPVPVVVLDPADPTVRETIARALREVDDAVLVETNFDRIAASYDEQADAVLAALVSGGRA